MRVLHVAESIKGGCGTYLDQVVPAQARDPAITALRVIVPDAHAGQVSGIAPDLLRRFARPDRSAAGLAALARALRAEVAAFRPDVVHLHSTFAGLVGRPLLAARTRRPRIVYCAHGWAFDMDRSGWKLRAMAAAERLLAPLADRIVAISDYERRRGEAVGIAPARLAVVHNGLADQPPAASPAPAPDGRLRLLFIGRLDRQKGCDTLLAAVEGLGDRVTLDLIGTAVVGDQAGGGPSGQAWPAHVRALGWCGAAEIGRALAAADLVVVPSRWEGFGLVALEAMRAGRAVLASDVGGLPEVVADGVTGRLVPPDDPAALRAALLAFAPAELAAMGAAGRRRFMDHFTVDRTVVGLSALYRDLLAGR